MNKVTISFVEGCLNFVAWDREIFFKWISRDIAGTLFFKTSRLSPFHLHGSSCSVQKQTFGGSDRILVPFMNNRESSPD